MANKLDLPFLRLGVNIDHIATLRNARGGKYPDPVRAARMALQAGADGLTVHLREDRRHIDDQDVARLMQMLDKPLNLEMAACEEMVEIALAHRPHASCLVPERREELTTEGGLDVAGHPRDIESHVRQLRQANIRTSLFIDPHERQIRAAKEVGADAIELHTGSYAQVVLGGRLQAISDELARLTEGARIAADLGLEVHAGHGLTFDNVAPIAAIAEIVELNIGHFLIAEAVFEGLTGVIRKMRAIIDCARAHQ